MANQEHLDILKQGVQAWNEWRTKNSSVQIDLSDANLSDADLSYAKLSDANLDRATMGFTGFGGIDLSVVKNLETVEHHLPSTIGIDTVYRSQGNIPEVFLKGAGVDDTFITYIRS